MNEGKLRKVVLVQEYDDDNEVMVETPWAEEVGKNQYQLKNFPFYFYCLSFDDIFEATPKYEDDERPYFTKVIKKSGHKTVRVVLPESIKVSVESKNILDHLNELGCGHEGSNGETFFVINIQPHCDFWQVCEYLTENNIEWEHADPTYEELYPEND